MKNGYAMANVRLEFDMPDSELHAFIQAIRTWDGGRDEIQGKILVDSPNLTVAQVNELLTHTDPGFPILVKFKRNEPDTPETAAEKAKQPRTVLDQLRKYWE